MATAGAEAAFDLAWTADTATPGSLRASRALGYAALIALTLVVWQAIHLLVGGNLLTGPLDVANRAIELWRSGQLQANVAISAQRLALGWAIGCLISIPLGLAMAQIPVVRRAVEPYLHFFRFIPPIAFVSLALIWFGIGETSKVVLIVYTTSFTVTVATLSAALSVRREAIWAAQSLGASPRQISWLVVVPATLPGIVTGMRLAMGTAFKTIIGAEMIGAKVGLGFMIWDARGFLDFETIFVGIVSLALMGLFADWLLRVLLRPIALRYGLPT
jgi:NitT/TauT family transport system permease protein